MTSSSQPIYTVGYTTDSGTPARFTRKSATELLDHDSAVALADVLTAKGHRDVLMRIDTRNQPLPAVLTFVLHA